MKHKVTITVEVDPTEYGTGVCGRYGYTPKFMSDTDRNAVKVVERAIDRKTVFPDQITISCGRVVTRKTQSVLPRKM